MQLAEKFHILSHIFISFIGAILLMAIWYNIRSRFKKLLAEDEPQKRIDKGLVYLSASLFVWVLSGIWAYLVMVWEIDESVWKHGVRSILSTFNNLFLLLSLFYFTKSPRFIYKNTKSIQRITSGIITLSLFSILLFQQFGNTSYWGMKISFLPDLILSGFLSYLLIVSFYKTFISNSLRIVAFISIGSVLILFYSQLPEVFTSMNDSFINNLMKIIAKTALISIFLVLATNWVIELAHTPKPSEMAIQFQDWSLVSLSIPSKNIHQQNIDFGSKTTQFKNLLKFALRRKFGEGDTQYIEIGNGGEIPRQTYLTRIVDNINDILNQQEDERLERKDLFTFVGQGKYRLRIVPDNIDIEVALLHEFVKDTDNQVYKSIVTN